MSVSATSTRAAPETELEPTALEPTALEPTMGDAVARLTPLCTELGDTKRVRLAGREGSLAAQSGRRAWRDLCSGRSATEVAWREAAGAVASCRAGPLDAAVLVGLGLDDQDARAVLVAAVEEQEGVLGPDLCAWLTAALPARSVGVEPPTRGNDALPWVVTALEAQPRAGATAPGRGRIVLEPPENHLEHTQQVAVVATLLAPTVGADVAVVFRAGLAHHLHNATLPDAGFTGEVLLGEHLADVVSAATERGLGAVDERLAGSLRDALAVVADATTAEGRAFHAADVLDRVLQQAHYARAAAFTLGQALDDLELVHAGPVQAFQLQVLAAAGLWTAAPAGPR